jgi:hypothetical protein
MTTSSIAPLPPAPAIIRSVCGIWRVHMNYQASLSAHDGSVLCLPLLLTYKSGELRASEVEATVGRIMLIEVRVLLVTPVHFCISAVGAWLRGCGVGAEGKAQPVRVVVFRSLYVPSGVGISKVPLRKHPHIHEANSERIYISHQISHCFHPKRFSTRLKLSNLNMTQCLS